MVSQVYHELREQLDNYSVGFPSTESGVEMKLLQKLFSEEEARLFLNLSLVAEAPEAVAARTKGDLARTTGLLERMAQKGLIFSIRKGDSVKYAAIPFVVGSYDYQVGTMDLELAQLFEQYLQEGFGKEAVGQCPPLRTIPVNQSLDYSWPVAPYEDVRQIIRSKDRISVANCICRVKKGLLEKSCDKPLEVCFSFGSAAQYYVENGMGRWISQDEALEILQRCEEAALVPQPFNAQNPGVVCNCCGDCCDILRSIKLYPKPAEMVICNYHASVDPDLCDACETCLDRCQMEAIAIGKEGMAKVDPDRCIGCGLCVTTCTTGALTLQPKPERERREPPSKPQDFMMQLAGKRGKSLVPIALQGASKGGF